jgi:DNA-binding MarR family transcriptional regulator
MGELSRRMMVSGGNITAIVDQLEKEQLVQRQVALADRRSFKVLLTPLGRKSFSQMAIAHEQWVIEIFSELSDQHQKQLANILGNLKVRIRQNYGNVKHQEKT